MRHDATEYDLSFFQSLDSGMLSSSVMPLQLPANIFHMVHPSAGS